MSDKKKRPKNPAASLDTLQKHINAAARKQAEAEWGKLEDRIDAWTKEFPAGHNGLRRNPREHYSSAPLMRLTVFPRTHAIEPALQSFASGWVNDRVEVIVEQMTKDLLTKASLIPST